MLPGKTYTPADILRIANRKKWLLVIPLVLGTAIAVFVGKQLPEKYRSETLIMLMQQRIPDSYVKSTVTAGLQERLTTLNQQILSRSRLERIILDFDLYPAERRSLPMEDVVQMMRGDIDPITLEGGPGASSFRLSYVGQDAKTVQKVTARLASLFIEENNRDRENIAEDTNQFLDTQLEDARRRLLEQEKKLEQYRQAHSGELPSQASSNMQMIQNAQMQLTSLADAEDRDRERRLLLERQLADLEAPDPLADPAADQGTGPSTAEQLETARTSLAAAELRLKPDHPDVRFLKRTIRDLEAKLEAEAARGVDGRKPRKPTAAEVTRQRRIRDLNDQIGDIDRQLRDKQDQVAQIRRQIVAYQAKVDALPKRESELVELTRDYNTLQSSYSNLLSRREESKLAVNLERRQIGEQFRILDPAKEAERPYSPNRPLINFIGAGAGLGLGILLVFLLEYRDSSFKSEADVIGVLNLPVLALVPSVMPRGGDRKAAVHRRAS
jgi:polysaccharide chain length determinant protein (PEP-CTERM system associated)